MSKLCITILQLQISSQTVIFCNIEYWCLDIIYDNVVKAKCLELRTVTAANIGLEII